MQMLPDRSRQLHPRRDGRRVLLRRDDLDAYIEQRAT